MFDWLNGQMHGGEIPSTPDIVKRIAAAMILGFVVAGIYVYTRPRHDTGTKGILATFVLLSILLSMVVMAVGTNIARSFMLAGVLAIVRFRTVVQDTRDGAFVICSVVVGMAAGAGFLDVAIIGLPFVAVAAYLTQNQQLRKVMPASTLKLKFQLAFQSQQTIESILSRYTDYHHLKASGTCKKGTAFEVIYRLRMKPGATSLDLVRDIKAMEGMTSVEWKA